MAERATIATPPQAAGPVRLERPRLGQWGAHDPAPLEDTTAFWRLIAQAATIVMCILMLGVFIYVARAFLLPVLCAVVVGMTLGPILDYLQARGVPSWLLALATVLGLIAIANIAVITLAGPVTDLTGRTGEFGQAVRDKLHILDRPLASLEELQVALGMNTSGGGVEISPARIIEGVLTIVTPAAFQLAVQLTLFFGTLFFFILGRSGFRKTLVHWFETRSGRLRALKIMNDVEDSLSSYLIVVTAINLGLGAVTTALAFALGLPAPLLWGVTAFSLNYIPYVGPGITLVLLFLVGLLTFPTLPGALLPPGIFLFITLIEGHFLTPAIIGRKVLSVHPLTVFLAIAFWAWLWGPIGAFLAMPILIVGRVTLDHLYPKHKVELPG